MSYEQANGRPDGLSGDKNWSLACKVISRLKEGVFGHLRQNPIFFYSLLPIYYHFLVQIMKQILSFFKQKKNPRKNIMNCHDNIHFNFHCFGDSYQPSETVFGRMYM